MTKDNTPEFQTKDGVPQIPEEVVVIAPREVATKAATAPSAQEARTVPPGAILGMDRDGPVVTLVLCRDFNYDETYAAIREAVGFKEK